MNISQFCCRDASDVAQHRDNKAGEKRIFHQIFINVPHIYLIVMVIPIEIITEITIDNT